MRITSLVVGLLVFLLGTIGCFMLDGGGIRVLIFPRPLLAEILITLGCSIVAFGARDVLSTFSSVTVLWTDQPVGLDCTKATRVIAAAIGYTYAAGAIVFLLNLVLIMATISEVVSSGLTEYFGARVASAILSLAYPILISEGILRTLKHRLATAQADAT